MGSLAGSSGVAYQMSQRSPMSYNIDITKSSSMTELSFGKFGDSREMKEGNPSKNIDAREVIHKHNANVSSFYKDSAMMSNTDESQRSSYYDELIHQLSSVGYIFEGRTGSDEDMSDISNDKVSQFYYYGITAVLLYLLYRTLYVKRK